MLHIVLIAICILVAHVKLFVCFSFQITVFRMGSEGHQDIDLAILTALLKGDVIVCLKKPMLNLHSKLLQIMV